MKTVSGVEYLYLTFNEGVTEEAVTTLDATQVKDYVTTTGTVEFKNGEFVANTNDTVYRVALSDIEFNGAVLAKGASVEIKLDATSFNDLAGNDLVPATVNVTRGEDLDSDVPAIVTGGIVESLDSISITYDKNLDGATAINKSNYSIPGVTIESAILTSANTVKLTLKADTVTQDGERYLTIKNLKGSNGVAIPQKTVTVDLLENVKPKISSAALTASDEITLTFSEDVNNVITTDGETADDFVVKIDGVNVTALATAATVTEHGTDGEKVYTLKLSRVLTPAEYAKTITVTPASSIDVEDGNGNLLSFTSVTVSK